MLGQTVLIAITLIQCINESMSILNNAAEAYVPEHRKNVFKFWWGEELRSLKAASVDANKLWKTAGKPHHGSVYSARQSSRKRYRARLRDKQVTESQSYTNDLHDALLLKNGATFWKCWQSKFEQTKKYTEVDGCVEANIIAGKFAQHFENLTLVIIKTEPIFLNRNIPSYEMNTVVCHFLIMLPLTQN